MNVLQRVTGGLSFKCPGCHDVHVIWVRGQCGHEHPVWDWNGDLVKPILSPSLLVTSGHYCAHWQQGTSCWCTFNEARKAKDEEPSGFTCYRCHSFIGCNGAAPGQIIFLSDSTHALAGQVVDLPIYKDTE